MTREGAWPYIHGEDDASSLGISFSGGGIRSAAFCLGAYQELLRQGLFQHARYLSGVSGGSYIASALTVAQGASAEEALRADPPPWSRGSPEERYLRNHLTFLAPGPAGRIWLVANYLYGFILNLMPFVIGSFLLGRVLGFSYRRFLPGLAQGGVAGALGHLLPVLLVECGLVLLALPLVGIRRHLIEGRRAAVRLETWLQRGATGLLAGVGVLIGLAVLVPLLVRGLNVALSHVSLWVGQPHGATFRRVLAGAVILAVSLSIGVVAVLLVQRGRSPRLQGVLASVSGVGILLIPLLLAAEAAAATGWETSRDVTSLSGGFALLVAFGFLVHNRRYSMHLYYRERLSRVFALERSLQADGDLRVAPVAYDKPIWLSALGTTIAERRKRGIPFPSLIVCAAVAARDGDVPNKSWASSFTFDAQTSGCLDLGLMEDTSSFEAQEDPDRSQLTLPAMMAISGAAISPTMGRFTLPAFRLLMVLMNLRLGVWLPNPFFSDAAARRTRPGAGRVRRALGRVVRAWREPGALYVAKEALGLADTQGRYLHVSDGGHWENLGLVELIRRRCTHILVVDASAGGRSPLQDIGRAAALARADLGAQVVLDPSGTVPDAASGLAQTPVVAGTVSYPDGSSGVIYYARCVLWPEAPVDLQVFRQMDQEFPRHPTANQLFSGEQFDAYRALGWEVARTLIADANLPTDQFLIDLDAEANTRPVLVL